MIWRIDVKTSGLARTGDAGVDPVGEAIRHQIAEFGTTVARVRSSRIFLIDGDADEQSMRRVADELLADPVVERAELINGTVNDGESKRIEVHLKPGVMDPVAASTEMAIRDMGIPVREVRTGRAYIIEGQVPQNELQRIASKVLANGVVESIHFDAFIPQQFPRGQEYKFKPRQVPMRDLGETELMKLSADGHLFLSLDEMKAIQNYFRQQEREPTDAELETLAQTWSEHCVHKTLKSGVELEVRDEAGKVVERRRYGNLIKETIFKGTMELIEEEKKRAETSAGIGKPGSGEFCLSVFADNAGVIAFDDRDAVCFKVETHNRPSAIDPYGGSATGAGGCIRDVMGTGLSAKPIANTDVFCVAYPNHWTIGEGSDGKQPLPKNVIHPRRILQQVVAGVRDYGNRMGIPTINGAVYFDDRYVGNPLVFCGCVGLIPRDKIRKQARSGDAIVLIGGRTGRDGIHGATFSSAELTEKHADEFAHAVQIGNAITEKKMMDVILAARDRGLFTAITDCGAGGLSSAVGEMGEKLGAEVELEKVPLKYAGLRYDEIWISEAQERMVMSVPQEHVPALLKRAAEEDVEATVIGRFGNDQRELVLRYQGHEVGRMEMAFVHGGIPMPMRKAVVTQKGARRQSEAVAEGKLAEQLLAKLAHPNIASKHWIISQYDHEVQGGAVIKPLVGPRQLGPSDAAVIRPKLNSHRGVAIGCGLAPQVEDPYEMAIAAIDEAVRNVVAVGASLSRIAMLDNFCWPGTHDEQSMGSLVRTCEACYDAAKAYGIPFISGKDSLHNQFTNKETGQVIRIPNTLLVSTIGVIEDVRRCVTMDLKRPGSLLCLVSPRDGRDLARLVAVHRVVEKAIASGNVLSCHDVSEGGWLVAAAEMAIGSNLGLDLENDASREFFAEENGRYLLEISENSLRALKEICQAEGVQSGVVARVVSQPHFKAWKELLTIDEMTRRWRGTLDW